MHINDELSWVSPQARLGVNVKLGLFVVVRDNVAIGDLLWWARWFALDNLLRVRWVNPRLAHDGLRECVTGGMGSIR